MNLDICNTLLNKNMAGIPGGAAYFEVCCYKIDLTKVMPFVLIL